MTWGSGAALKALTYGIPCFHGFDRWIGAEGSTPLAEADFNKPQKPDRLAMFRKLIWAMWTVGEIKSGEAFASYATP